MLSEPTIPEGLDVLTESDGSTVVRRRWRSWLLIPLGAFALLWNGFLFSWYRGLFTRTSFADLAFWFPLLHVAAGIAMVYFFFASLVNVTDIRVSGSGVRVRTGPLPWPGNRTVPADAIRQIQVCERTASGRNQQVTYRIMYAGADNRERRLVDSLSERDQAEYVAYLVRRTLRLPAPPAA